MSRLLTLLVCLVIATSLGCATIEKGNAAPGEPTIPWTTFSGPMVSAAAGAQMGRCPQGEILIAHFRHENTVFTMLFAPETNRIMFVYDPNPQDKNAAPTFVGFGLVNPDKHDEIPTIRWQAFDERIHGNPCALLFLVA